METTTVTAAVARPPALVAPVDSLFATRLDETKTLLQAVATHTPFAAATEHAQRMAWGRVHDDVWPDGREGFDVRIQFAALMAVPVEYQHLHRDWDAELLQLHSQLVQDCKRAMLARETVDAEERAPDSAPLETPSTEAPTASAPLVQTPSTHEMAITTIASEALALHTAREVATATEATATATETPAVPSVGSRQAKWLATTKALLQSVVAHKPFAAATESAQRSAWACVRRDVWKNSKAKFNVETKSMSLMAVPEQHESMYHGWDPEMRQLRLQLVEVYEQVKQAREAAEEADDNDHHQDNHAAATGELHEESDSEQCAVQRKRPLVTAADGQPASQSKKPRGRAKKAASGPAATTKTITKKARRTVRTRTVVRTNRIVETPQTSQPATAQEATSTADPTAMVTSSSATTTVPTPLLAFPRTHAIDAFMVTTTSTPSL